MKLELDDAVDIVHHDPMFRIERKGFLASLFGYVELRIAALSRASFRQIRAMIQRSSEA